MSTTYDATPSILDRVAGSDLILLGVAHGPVRIEPIPDSEPPRVHGWFELRPERVLSGDPEPSTVVFRVLGSGTGEKDVTWLVPVPTETTVLALLIRDVGAGVPEGVFAPCFAGIYELSDDGRIRVPDEALDPATRDLIDAGSDGLTVEHLGRVIDGAGHRRAEDRRRLEDEEPRDVRRRPRQELFEYPRSAQDVADVSRGGGRDARLD
ncbi:hypothetical protein OHA72_38725 [Dactylosporangium sp. NBC_01737]|uniref:hypothetical protein n=1 Tax=Dactylosporangium sp. NBC_01737 TaxID=2975959 RepID=UPI002E1335BF|nr:hypothetical protein OHA72_38725 [Dactylosporangium sp. NBC_01737]